MSRRQEKVNSVIHHELSNLFLFHVSDPVLRKVSIQEVSVSPDLKVCRVFYLLSAEEKDKELRKAFKRVEPMMRAHFSKTLSLKQVPKFEFVLDTHYDEFSRVTKLLDSLRESQPTP